MKEGYGFIPLKDHLELYNWFSFITCILLFRYLLIWVIYPCNFNEVLSITDGN